MGVNLFNSFKSSIIIRFMYVLRNQLGINNSTGFINYDDGSCIESPDRTVNVINSICFAEFSVAET